MQADMKSLNGISIINGHDDDDDGQQTVMTHLMAFTNGPAEAI